MLWVSGRACTEKGVLVVMWNLEVEHLPGCENWPPARGRHTFSLPVLKPPSFRVEGGGEGGSEAAGRVGFP